MNADQWRFRIVDVFTDRPLAGNQLAVFTEATPIPESLLQPLAQEIGYSETVFVYPLAAAGTARIRIFTPVSEIPFAGHPVLGTAVVLASGDAEEEVVLETGRGAIHVQIRAEAGHAARGTMQQPEPAATPYPESKRLLQALGLRSSVLPVTLYDNGIPHVYVMVERPEDVAALVPDLAALSRLAREPSVPVVGFNVFSGSGTTWKTRMFAPAAGVPEDPATGSAAGPLVVHIARHGLVPWGTDVTIRQGEEVGRPSTLFARVLGSADRIVRIEVGGHAVPVGGGWFDPATLSN